MDTANDLSQIMLVILGTVGFIVALLFLLAAIEPPTTRSRYASGTDRIAPPTPARTDRETARPAEALPAAMRNSAAS